MSAYSEKRLNSLRSFISDKREALLLTDEVNIGYFCGFFHSEGALLVTRSRAVLFVDFRYIEAAKQKADCEVVCFKRLYEEIGELCKNEDVELLHLEASHITVQRFGQLKKILDEFNVSLCTDGRSDSFISDIRVIKDPSELEKIQTAQTIAEKAYLELLNDIKAGVTERELAARLQFYMLRNGAEAVSFDLITISGKKTSLPHGVPSDNRVCEGDFFTCDFGAVYDGYHSDTTRTVAVGHASDEMMEIYDIVLRAQLTALDKVMPGVLCSDIDKTARDIISEAGYGDYFGHATGHGVGLYIHEQPSVSSKSKTVLRTGMVITDEPGIYLPNRFGVRIEDMLSVTEQGYHNFVSLSKELIVI